MDTKTIGIIAVVVLIIVVGAAVALMHRAPPTTTMTTPTTTTTKTTTTTTTTTSPSPTMTTTTTTPTETTTASVTETTTSPKPGVALTILSRHPGDILYKTKLLFMKSEIARKYHITDLHFVVVPPGLWPATAEAKHVDVGWGGGPTLFDTMYIKNLLAPLTSEIAINASNQIPDTLAGVSLKRKSEDGHIYWVSAAISSFGFTVNTDLAMKYNLTIPQKWEDLGSLSLAKILVTTLNPPLGIADPTASTSNTRMYEIILQAFGWDEGWRLLTLMAANAHIYGASGDVRDAVIRGERIVGITIDFYGYTAHQQNPACIYIAPPGETIVNGDPIALFSTAAHPSEGQAFIAWVLTEGQKIWLDKDINRLPANPSVFDTPEGKQRTDLKQFFEEISKQPSLNFNDTLALSYEFMMQQFFKATLIDQHEALQNAWKTLVYKYINGEISEDQFEALKKKLTDPIQFINPLTGEKVTWSQDVAIQLNKAYLSGNAAILDQLMKEWRDAAATKYNEVLKELGG